MRFGEAEQPIIFTKTELVKFVTELHDAMCACGPEPQKEAYVRDYVEESFPLIYDFLEKTEIYNPKM